MPLAVRPSATSPSPFWTGMPASLVLGAPNLNTYWDSQNASAFESYPELASMDPHGDIWVTDFGANRVLEFQPPFSNGEAASTVIGQSSFSGNASGTSSTNLSHPAAATIDPRGDLWVSDWANNRVMEFVPPFQTGMAASLVLGQSNFAGNYPAGSATNLSHPIGISFDRSDDLWLGDASNNRILEFKPPFSTGMSASLVLGQDTFTGNQTAGVTATNLSYPVGALVSGSTLWVADLDDDRVLAYNAPFTTGEAATLVLGQPSLTSSGATGEGAFNDPTSVSVDSFGDLWVSDFFDNRVVEFTPPFTNFENPNIALGQNSLTGTQSGLSATNLTATFGTLFDPAGNLWVTDGGNNRIVEFVVSHYSVTVRETGLPAGTTWKASVDSQNDSGTGAFLFSETNGTYSLNITPVAGYHANPAFTSLIVNGSDVNITFQFTTVGPNPFSPGMPASVVLGQAGFDSRIDYTAGQVNASTLSGDWDVAFDAKGDLWVADELNNRVLEFVPPFTNFMTASLVLGQSNYTGNQGGDAATNLTQPNGLAFDAQGNLWVSDSGNNRVLEFTTPFSSGMAASLVLGQATFGTDGSGNSAATLDYPFGLAFSNGNLWVADSLNNRVLEYLPTFSDGEDATTVLGQSSFVGDQANISATNLSDASWLAFDSHGNLWVSDWGNGRVVQFPTPFITGEAATVVLGQPNLTTNTADYNDSFLHAGGIWIDAHGDLWAADVGHNRVFEYAGPTSSIVTNQTPMLVIGQGNLTSTGAATTRTGLNGPTAVGVDPEGDLWVVDSANYRVLEYAPTSYGLNFTTSGLPSGITWGVGLNGSSLSSSTGFLSRSVENGTYAWTATPVAGWVASPASGSISINGAGATVAIVYAPFDFTVTFTEKGLPTGTSWSVTIGSVTHPSAGTTVTFSEPNGSYSYTIGPVSGYSAANGTGVVSVSAAAAGVTITFAVQSGSSSASGFSTTDWILIGVLILVVVVLAALVLLRRKKAPPAPPTAWTPPTGSAGAPPGAMGPPPGAMGGPPPGASP
jgi:sugar lactone lactonase YvrE